MPSARGVARTAERRTEGPANARRRSPVGSRRGGAGEVARQKAAAAGGHYYGRRSSRSPVVVSAAWFFLLLSHREAGVIAPGNDRKRPLRRRFAEQRLCRVLDGVVAPRADGDPRWLGGLGQGKGQFQHAMVAVGGDVSRRRRWSGYSTTKDESWTAKVPCCRFCPCGSASEFGERERVGFRFLAPRTRPVRHRRAGRYRSRRLLLARAATTCRRRAWDGQVRRQHGAEVVPAGTADRGDVLGGVSAGTVPTAGAVREDAPGQRPRPGSSPAPRGAPGGKSGQVRVAERPVELPKQALHLRRRRRRVRLSVLCGRRSVAHTSHGHRPTEASNGLKYGFL